MKKGYIAVVAITVVCSGCMGFGNTQIRTVDATKAKFDAGLFTIGKTTKEQVKARLGSPSEIKTLEGGSERWTYIKTEEQNDLSLKNIMTFNYSITTDVGTHYIAEYTFDMGGVLSDVAYRAAPMSHPMLR